MSDTVERANENAITASEQDGSGPDAPRPYRSLLEDLDLSPEQAATALDAFEQALARRQAPEARGAPRLVFLFSGHMIDAPGRPTPRFPPDKEPIAAQAIADKLDSLGAGPDDLALCGGACGGDLLFAETCLERSLRLEVRIPFEEPLFLQKSVAFAGSRWVDRFYQVKAHPRTRLLVMPDELGPVPAGGNPYVWDNLWQLYAALARGPEHVRFLCLWNRQAGDGPGGTKHMRDTVRKFAGRSYILDTNILW